MAEPDRSGPGAGSGADAEPQRSGNAGALEAEVLHVDPNPAVVEALADALADREGDLAVTHAAPDEAAATYAATAPDCVVTERVDRPDWTDVLAEFAGPALLYTAADPDAVSDPLLRTVDTLVEKPADAGDVTFVTEKVLSLLTDQDSADDYAFANALAAVERDAAGTCEFVVDEDGAVLWASDRFEDVFPVEAISATVPTTASLYERLRAVFADSPEVVASLQVDAPAQTEQTLSVETAAGPAHFVRSSRRLPAAMDGHRLETFQDVTSAVNREARAELFELLVEEAQDGLYTLDERGNVEFCNDSFAEMLGYEREELVGKHGSYVLPEGELEHGQEAVQRLIEQADAAGEVVDMTFETKAGEHLDVSIHFTTMPSGQGSYAGLICVARDITARKEYERTLEQYQTLVEGAGDPMYVLDDEGHIELLNHAMAEFLGEPSEAIVGRHVREFLPEDGLERAEDALRRILRDDGKQWETQEFWLQGADGQDRRFEITIGAITDEGGEFVGSIGTYRDITDRKQREEELELLKQVFARVLRHNIRNEVTTIIGHAQMLGERLEGREADMAETVVDRAKILSAMSEKARAIEEILETERGETTHDLAHVVHRSLTELDDTEAADVTVDVDDDVYVRANWALPHAIENVVENAIEHAHAGTPAIDITAETAEGTVSLVVSDDGPGIPASELEVLDRGAETPLEHGSGIGLWLVQWVLEHSDGDLSFETGGEGTTVTMTFQRAGTPSE